MTSGLNIAHRRRAAAAAAAILPLVEDALPTAIGRTRAVLELRITHPKASYRELGAMLQPAITKDSVRSVLRHATRPEPPRPRIHERTCSWCDDLFHTVNPRTKYCSVGHARLDRSWRIHHSGRV